MNIIDKIRERFGPIKISLPFIKLIGHEKIYGRSSNRDYDNMITKYNSWVYACVQRNAFSIAKCDLKVYKKAIRDNSIVHDEIIEHPFLETLTQVNPFFNKLELWTLTSIFLELTGNAYWWIVTDRLGVPREFWNIPSNWVKIVPSKTQFIAGYVVQPPGQAKPTPFQEHEILHFKYPSPFDIFYGSGPLIAAQYGVDMNEHLKLHGINFLMNNAQPSGALYTEDSLSDEQFKRLEMQWNRKHKGSKNSGKMAILEAGLKYEKIGQGLGELRFDDIARTTRDEILAIFGVPASKLGLVEDVNRANAEANDYTYQKETIEPRLMLIQEKINEKLMPRYDTQLVCKFVSPVPYDKDFRLREQAEHIRSGYSSIDDERAKDNEQPYNAPETQSPLIPFSVLPAGSEKPASTNPNGNNNNDDDDEKSYIVQKDAKARRTRKWEIFANMIAPQEKLMQSVMERYFKSQHDEVMRNLANYRSYSKDVKAGITATILFNLKEQINKLAEMSKPNVKEAMISGANLAGEEMGMSFDLIEPKVLMAIEKRVMFFAQKVNESTVTLLTDEITESVSAGETIEQLSKRISKVMEYSELYRSRRIARTEVVGAANQGQLVIYRESGVQQKQWITARDEKVRESHMIDGQTVGITEDFVTNMGSHLNYPGDREGTAPAEDLINCRCSIIAVRPKE